jgi:hypothetical protein
MLVFIDIFNLLQSLIVLSIFFSNAESIETYCRPSSPVIYVVLPTFAFLGAFIALPRCMGLFYLFVYAEKKARI